MSNHVTAREKSEIRDGWLRYLFNLAPAEEAASRQCEYVARQFGLMGLKDESEQYMHYAREESGHANLIASLTGNSTPTTEKTHKVLSGDYYETSARELAQPLMIIHSIFEPSALVFMGAILRDRNLLFEGHLAESLRVSLGTIVREEINHVYQGSELIAELIEQGTIRPPSSAEVDALIFHRKYIQLSFLGCFSRSLRRSHYLASHVTRYQKSLKRAVKPYELFIRKHTRRFAI